MAERLNNVAFLVLLTVAASLRSAAATTYVVGDALGWTIPPMPYSNWVSNKTFFVGDILVFNFTSGQHDVTEVTKGAYDSCTGNNPISVETTSPARITLAAAGDRHFICSFPGHCDGGQKLSITVQGPPPPAAPPRASTPSPTAAPSLPPRPSIAPSPSPASPSPRSGAAPKSSPPTATPPPENATPPATSIAPSTPSPTTAPPPPNSANSLGVHSFSAAVLAIVIALF